MLRPLLITLIVTMLRPLLITLIALSMVNVAFAQGDGDSRYPVDWRGDISGASALDQCDMTSDYKELFLRAVEGYLDPYVYTSADISVMSVKAYEDLVNERWRAAGGNPDIWDPNNAQVEIDSRFETFDCTSQWSTDKDWEIIVVEIKKSGARTGEDPDRQNPFEIGVEENETIPDEEPSYDQGQPDSPQSGNNDGSPIDGGVNNWDPEICARNPHAYQCRYGGPNGGRTPGVNGGTNETNEQPPSSGADGASNTIPQTPSTSEAQPSHTGAPPPACGDLNAEAQRFYDAVEDGLVSFGEGVFYQYENAVGLFAPPIEHVIVVDPNKPRVSENTAWRAPGVRTQTKPDGIGCFQSAIAQDLRWRTGRPYIANPRVLALPGDVSFEVAGGAGPVDEVSVLRKYYGSQNHLLKYDTAGILTNSQVRSNGWIPVTKQQVDQLVSEYARRGGHPRGLFTYEFKSGHGAHVVNVRANSAGMVEYWDASVGGFADLSTVGKAWFFPTN
ncbi:MAG: hypothetical protein AAGC77_13295 [Pseudomonadota bacterium]